MKLPTLPSEPAVEPPAFELLGGLIVEISDLDRGLRFWSGLLGLPLLRSEPAPRRRYFLGVGSGFLCLSHRPDLVRSPGPVATVALSVPSLEALEALRGRLMAGGVPVSGLVEDDPFALVRFRDPTTGLLVEARWQGRPWEPRDQTLDTSLEPTARELLGLPANG